MSNAAYPSLPGLDWSVVKRPIHSTIVTQNPSGKEVRVALWQDPIYEFEHTFNYLRDDPSDSARLINGATEMQTLLGFIVARQGQFDSFLYLDPTDNVAQGQACNPPTGDGTNKLFQLCRQLGGNGYSESVQNVYGTPAIYVNGVLQSPSSYSISATGQVSFDTAPGAGLAVQWSGNFYYRCRFSADQTDFTNWIGNVWENKKVTFKSVKQ